MSVDTLKIYPVRKEALSVRWEGSEAPSKLSNGVYEILSSSLPEAQAKAVAKAINQAIEADTERKKELLATKEDLANLRAELKEDIANVKAELIKWMFIFWISQIGVLTGIIFAMLKLYFK